MSQTEVREDDKYTWRWWEAPVMLAELLAIGLLSPLTLAFLLFMGACAYGIWYMTVND